MTSVIIEDNGDQAVLRLALPPVNAMGLPLLRDLDAAVARLVAAPPRRGLVVTGEGRSFCAGADIKAAPHYTPADWAEVARLADRAFTALPLLPVPTVAALNGHALGGGLVLALACDVRLATTLPARFGLPEVAHDIAFPVAALALVRENLAPAVQRDLVLSGRVVGNAAAVELGLVDALVPAQELLARAQEMATDRASLGRRSRRNCAKTSARASHAGRPRHDRPRAHSQKRRHSGSTGGDGPSSGRARTPRWRF